jgi:poly-gamma-glutamate synthesis protein (capsule biosynthesis protein)
MLKEVPVKFLVGVLSLVFLSCSENGITITFTGDILLDRGIRKQIEHTGVASLFTGVAEILHRSVFVVGNLECPLTIVNNPQNKQYTFRGEPMWASSLRKAGFTHLDVANNHTCDQGETGFTQTIESIKRAGIRPVGAIDSQTNPILMIAGTDTCTLYASNLVGPEPGESPQDCLGPCRKGADTLASMVQQCRIKHPGYFIMVLLHWGREHDETVFAGQSNSAHKLIDGGADVVIGHHPHILQSIEIYNGKPIIYSLGNFVFDESQLSATNSMVISLIIKKNILRKIRIYPIKIANGIPSWENSSDFIIPLIPKHGEALIEICRK